MSFRRPLFPRFIFNKVSCVRNGQQVLRNLNLSVHEGGATVVLGSNGSGKTTLLRLLARLEQPSAGHILWDGHDISKSGVYQQYKLQLNWFSHEDPIDEKLTVLRNVEWYEGVASEEGKSLAAVEFMGLGEVAEEKSGTLSTGQRQRLKLARLLAIDRPIWLLDEPSVALDAEGLRLLEFVIRRHRKYGGVVFVATHLPISIEDAMFVRLPDRFKRRSYLEMLD